MAPNVWLLFCFFCDLDTWSIYLVQSEPMRLQLYALCAGLYCRFHPYFLEKSAIRHDARFAVRRTVIHLDCLCPSLCDHLAVNRTAFIFERSFFTFDFLLSCCKLDVPVIILVIMILHSRDLKGHKSMFVEFAYYMCVKRLQNFPSKTQKYWFYF